MIISCFYKKCTAKHVSGITQTLIKEELAEIICKVRLKDRLKPFDIG